MNLSLEEYFETADTLISRASELSDIALENASNQILSNSDVKRIYQYANELGIRIQHQATLENHSDVPVTWSVAMEGIGDIISKIIEGIKKVISFIIDKIKSLFGFGGGGSSSSSSSDSKKINDKIEKTTEKLKDATKLINPHVPDSERERIARILNKHFDEEYLNKLKKPNGIVEYIVEVGEYAGQMADMSDAIEWMVDNTVTTLSKILKYAETITEDDAKAFFDKYQKEPHFVYSHGNFKVYQRVTALVLKYQKVKDLPSRSEIQSEFNNKFPGEFSAMVHAGEEWSEKGIADIIDVGPRRVYKLTYPLFGNTLMIVVETNETNGTYYVSSMVEKGFAGESISSQLEGKDISLSDPKKYLDAINSIRDMYNKYNVAYTPVFEKSIQRLDDLKKVIEKGDESANKLARDESSVNMAAIRRIAYDEINHYLKMIGSNTMLIYYRQFTRAMILIDSIIPQKWEDVKK